MGRVVKIFKFFLLAALLLPSVTWSSEKCDKLAVIAEDTMRKRQSGADFFVVFKPVIDGYIERIKKTNSISEVRALTASFNEVFAVAKVAQEVDIEVDGKLQNEAIYSFSDKIKTLCIKHD